ncbi:hypothetical protein ACFT7S_00140 [Streptomyces sp. NPDC057136]|uniref:hypothetical protein n=1 Tax=Streptomyces sp. NPDC057136 TaxID=3346029 RepID=UPI00362A6E51
MSWTRPGPGSAPRCSPSPAGRTPTAHPAPGLPAVPPVRLSALARRGSGLSLTGAAVEAVRALLASRETDRAA